MIQPGLDTQDLLRRFRNERQTLAALNHPNIVSVLDGGNTDDGLPYLVMDYVEGTPLDEYCDDRKLSIDERLQLFRKVCEAVQYAHMRLIIHRDLKPGNILVTADGTPKLLDFGIAKLLNPDPAATLVVTRTGQRAMTPQYASPEQVRGEPLTNATDIYSLGVVLYELLTGHKLYRLKTHAMAEIERAICEEEPLMPSTVVTRAEQKTLPNGTTKTTIPEEISRVRVADPKKLRDRLLGDLDAIVMTALRKEPQGRYASVYELSEDIRRHLEGMPIKSRHSTSTTTTGGNPSVNPEANRYFEFAMLSLPRYDLQRMRQMFVRALDLDARFAEARAWFGFTDWLMLDAGHSNDTALLYGAEEQLRLALQDDARCASAHAHYAAVFFFQAQKELARLEAERALEINPGNTEAHHLLMHYHHLNGDYLIAEPMAKALMERDPLFWPARMVYGDLRRQQGHPSDSITEQKKIIEQDPQSIHAIQYVTRAYLDSGDLESARRFLEPARSTGPRNYWVRLHWAVLLALEGKRDEARREMDENVAKWAATVVWYTAMVAGFFAVINELGEAFAWLERAVRNGDERAEGFAADPLLASLRDHPRFRQILDSIAYRRQLRMRSTSAHLRAG